MRPFQYIKPGSLDELLRLLQRHGTAAKILAGGTDLLVRLRLGHVAPQVVVDIKGVAALSDGIVEVDGALCVGARTLMRDVVGHPRVRRHFPALIEAARVVGSVQIRNRATLVGNVCNASPAADTAPALLAYGAVANIVGAGRRRRAPLTAFFVGPGRTVLAADELLESIELPIPAARTGAAFARVTRRYGVDLAILNLCCLVAPSGRASFAYGAVGPRPFLVEDRSGTLTNLAETAEIRDDMLRRLTAVARPISDVRARQDYRMAMLIVVSRRALETALERRQRSKADP